tara:strand:+ start:215 stop:496 length:282 start_codon:yes stop_codon:yes gene_type:complete
LLQEDSFLEQDASAFEQEASALEQEASALEQEASAFEQDESALVDVVFLPQVPAPQERSPALAQPAKAAEEITVRAIAAAERIFMVFSSYKNG